MDPQSLGEFYISPGQIIIYLAEGASSYPSEEIWAETKIPPLKKKVKATSTNLAGQSPSRLVFFFGINFVKDNFFY